MRVTGSGRSRRAELEFLHSVSYQQRGRRCGRHRGVVARERAAAARKGGMPQGRAAREGGEVSRIPVRFSLITFPKKTMAASVLSNAFATEKNGVF